MMLQMHNSRERMMPISYFATVAGLEKFLSLLRDMHTGQIARKLTQNYAYELSGPKKMRLLCEIRHFQTNFKDR